MKLFAAVAVFAAVALLIGFGWMRSARIPDPVRRTQVALGTFVEIEVRGMAAPKANRAIDAAFQEVQRIHRTFSPFNESGRLWRVNHSPEETVTVDRELYDLLLACDVIHRETEGAFDPAMEKLFEVWRVWGNDPVIPARDAVEQALALSGWRHVGLGDDLELRRKPGVAISFGAIAKGYAVDRMVETLESCGVRSALVNAGGEIRTLGDDWIVGVQHPSIRREMVRTISLSGMAVATSGDYEQSHEEKGVRYHHILNPATGYPATGCSSVTIVARTCMEADAYATGVFVLGPVQGLALVNRTPGMDAMVIDRAGAIFYSNHFEDYVWRRP